MTDTDTEATETEALTPSYASRYATNEGRAFLRQQKGNINAALAYLYYCRDLESKTFEETLRGNHSARNLLDVKELAKDPRTGKVTSRPPRGARLADRIRANEQELALINAALKEAGEDTEPQEATVSALASRLQSLEDSFDTVLDFIEALKAQAAAAVEPEEVA